MKKVLFATTALVASAGFAAADFTITGGAVAGLKDTGSGDAYLHTEIDFNIVGSGTSDNGLTFGASIDLDDEHDGTGRVSDTEIFVSGSFGTVTVGELDNAIDGVGMPDLGFDGIGIDDDVEANRNAGGANFNYAYSMDAFSLAVSADLGDDSDHEFGLAVGYSANGLGVKVGYNSDDFDDDSWALQASYSANALTVGALYADNGSDNGFGVWASYAMDALTITVAANDVENGGDNDYGVGFSYGLGGGLSVAGAFGEVDGETVMDLGLTMSF
ncbi:porin [Actibacterium pelagium]|uniref:Porin n=1 Tax=Actibacterium pelagium TaxID=2029103 RepID=A0A917AL49_9RHOB|nr:porin [Actibacterium pelagium]GGE56483.1 porin [Actibacterium pelagium]